MIGVVVITHGTLSEQLLATAALIMGNQKDVYAVSFTARESLDNLRQKANAAIEPFKTDGCLILTDIMGGSATNVCVELMKNEKVEVLTGANLPMLLEAISYRDGADLKALASRVQASGVKSIINLKEFFEKRAAKKA
ncbi:MAG TPA: PTS sugar transporter subunit IIA [Candidatus Rifleibacterium sp.]|jgi:mannose/fructose/sorbose-specific phosphotransferase system IIA component|nr:PTS sugar transporter subunit IIA [Candidatus Rifleibacterium sp.]HOI91646.1 PTS sugar transporter subunit IIA [Candidatus Rifleibacterium sp.]